MLSRRVAALEPSIIREMSNRRRPSSIDLSLGEPALTPDREVMSRAWRAIEGQWQGYTQTAGLPELREAIARHYALPGRDRPENAIATVGSEEAVFVAMLSTLDPGDEVLIPEPGYPAYLSIARLIGAKPVSYPIQRETGLVARAEAIGPRITSATRAIVLNGPSNPFGTVDEPEELEAIVRLCESRGVTVISDEIYGELYYGETPPPSAAKLTERSIFVSGLSKSCALTGHRLGFLVAGTELVKKASLAHQLAVTCSPRLSQLAALEVLKQPGLLRAHVPYYREARAAAIEAGNALPAGAPLFAGGGAFYAIIDVSAYCRRDPFALAVGLFEAEDVIVVPGVAFGASGDWFWRLSYAAGAEPVREGLRRIARFLAAR